MNGTPPTVDCTVVRTQTETITQTVYPSWMWWATETLIMASCIAVLVLAVFLIVARVRAGRETLP